MEAQPPAPSASLSPKVLTRRGLSLASEHAFPGESHVRAGVEGPTQTLCYFPRRKENVVALEEPSLALHTPL